MADQADITRAVLAAQRAQAQAAAYAAQAQKSLTQAQTLYNNFLRLATWKGPWFNPTNYQINDLVESNGSTYICIRANSGHEPPDLTYWNLVAAGSTLPSQLFADGVSIDGDGTEENPFSVIPEYITDLVGDGGGDGTAGWTPVNVLTSEQDQDITVNGETGYVVELMGVVLNAAGANATLTLQPNADGSNQIDHDTFTSDLLPTSVQNSVGSNWIIGFARTGGVTKFHVWFYMKAGTLRFIDGTYVCVSSSNVITSQDIINGIWTDTTTPVTSLRLHSDQANGIGSGSIILWRTIPLAS